MIPASFSPWATWHHVKPSPRNDLPGHEFNEEPFTERLLARRERMRARASTQLRSYWAGRRTSLDGPGQRERAFDSAARIMGSGPDLPDYELRLRLLADELPVRRSSVSTAQANPDARLLCDTQGRPILAFAPVGQAASAWGRGSMAAVLDEALQADQGLSLGINRPVLHQLPNHGMGLLTPARGAASVKALQTLALSRVFTNDWQARWQEAPGQAGGKSWYLAGCAPFPERAARAEALADMQEFRGIAPLFEVPPDAGSAWDCPLDPALAAKVQALDLDSLQWMMEIERKNQCKAPDATPPSAETILGSIASIRVVRTLIEEEPTLTLRQLLARFPHRLDVPDEHRAVGHRDAAQQTGPAPVGRPAPQRATGEHLAHERLLQDLRDCVDGLQKEDPVAPALPSNAPALEPDAMGSDLRIDDTELSELLRQAAPSTRFKWLGPLSRFLPSPGGDHVLAPLLRQAFALRSRRGGAKTRLAALKLRDAAEGALRRTVAKTERSTPDRQDLLQAVNHRVATLSRLIVDTESRHGIPALSPDEIESPPSGRSWRPWRRGAQRKA